MAFRLVGKQLAAGRVLLGAPRTQMRYAGGDGRYIVIVRGAKLTGRVGYERVENGANWQMWKIDQSSNEVYTERSMEIEKILKELS
ncbi:uncharacterized protein [Nicotiana tomentosiformis]|uniref:uncharacterized protein isoform X9 n=1 Tax=Nicotiana tomentosiformis TaxID=4098 RepID=UPI00388C4B64